MKFSTNGIGKKNGFRFEIHYSTYLDGQHMEDPYYLYCCRPTLNNKYNEGTFTERTLRFKTQEEAEVFCEKVADGAVSLTQLKATEDKAVAEHLAKKRAAANKEVDSFMSKLEQLGVDPVVVPQVVSAYHKMHNVLSSSYDCADLFAERLEQLKANPTPKRSRKTLADHMELTERDIDVILVDKDTGEHSLPCVCFVPEHRRNDPEIGYDDWENWVRSLPLKRLIDVNGVQVAVVKTDFSLDETCFLLGENEFETTKWSDLYVRSVWSGAEFQDRLDFLKTGKSFEHPFDATRMDALAPSDRAKIQNLLQDRTNVFIATYPKDESQYYVYSYQFSKEGRPLYDYDNEIDIKLTELGQGFTSTFEGKVCWAQYVGNKARSEALAQAEKANGMSKEVNQHDR